MSETAEASALLVANQDFARIEQAAGPLVEQVKAVKITSEASYASAAALLTEISTIENQVEDRRTFFTKPLNEILKGINASAKTRVAALVEAKALLTKKLGTWILEKEQKERDARAKQQAATEKAIDQGKPIPVLKPVAEVAKTIQTSTGASVTMRSIWKYEIIGPVPQAFTTPDLPKIGKYVTAMKGDAAQPWLKVWEEKSAAVR